MAGERTIRIRIDGDAKGLVVSAKAAESEVERLAKQVEAANRRFVEAAAGGAKFALAMSALSSSTSGLASFGATLTTATGALVGLPALAAAGGAAMATLALGAEGATQSVEALSQSLDPLRQQVSIVLRESLEPAVESINRILPRTADGFSAIAEEMGGVASAAARTLELPANQADLNELLGDTAGLMSGLRDAAEPATDALVDLIAVGSGGFPALGDRIAEASAEFAGFIAAARESGQLREMLDDGIDALQRMWQTLQDIGAIVGGVFSGISEGADGVTSATEPAIQAMRDFVESTGGQETLRQIGEALAEIGEAVGGVLASGLDAAGPLVGPLAESFAALASTAASFLIPALNAVAPILEVVAGFLEENEQLVRVVASVLIGLRVAYLSVHGAILLVNAATARWNRAIEVARGRAATLTTSIRGMGRAARIASLSMGAIGVALSVAGGLMAVFSSQSDAAAARQRRLADFAEAVADEIERQNGLYNENVRRVAAAQAEQNGWAQAARDAGVASRDLIDALLGDEDARRRAVAQLDAHIAGMDDSSAAYIFEAGAAGVLRDALTEANGAIRDQVDLNRFLAEGVRETARWTGWAADAETQFALQVRRLSDAHERQLRLHDQIQEQRRRAAGITLDARDAERAYEESIDDATDALRRNGRTIDTNTAAGRANEQALDDLATTVLDDVIPSMQAQGATTDQVRAKVADARSRFISLATAMGHSAADARTLADRLGLIPGTYSARVTADTSQAMAAVQELERQMEAVTRNRSVGFFADAFGARATGGPVVGGRTYLVGERGPELFRAPNSGGHIVPNHELAGQGGDTIVYVEIDGEQLQGRITRTVREHDRGIRRAVTAGTGAGR